MLLYHFQQIIESWQFAFSQKRTLLLTIRLALGLLCTPGRRTIARSICCFGDPQHDWSSDYYFFSRSKWDVNNLFQPILQKSMPYCRPDYVSIAFDDTKLHKTGRHIKSAFYQRDPLSPPFHTNLILGQRFLQASVILPHYRHDPEVAPRGIPVRFEEVPAVKKPGKRGTPQDWKDYRQAQKERNLSHAFVNMLTGLRKSLDQAGASERILIATVDGSFCNQTVFQSSVPKTVLVARTRKDTRLCFRDNSSSRRFYAHETFNPEQVRQDETIPYQTATVFHGGQFRAIRYKEVNHVLWQRGAKRRPLRLIVVAPTPYLVTPKSRRCYRDPAYLLVTDTEMPTTDLIQEYFNRWQIEVNHRDEKDLLGVGQAQVRAEESVPRQPAFVVAAYSALLLASLIAYGPRRTEEYGPPPRWARERTRPSIADMLSLLRRQYIQYANNNNQLHKDETALNMITGAHA